jgi:peptide/nickel transport system ATP-binding protein
MSVSTRLSRQSTQMSKLILTVSGLSKRFSTAGALAVDDVSFHIDAGETLALAGPSGGGKSTIARLLTRLITPDSGEIRFDGEDFLALRGQALRDRRADLQMVFQDPLSAFNPRTTVGLALDAPLRIHGIASGAERPRLIAAALERVGLDPNMVGRAIHEISGGQRQRVAIARAMATKPKLIVLDEAVSALDVSVRKAILELLSDLQKTEGTAYLFISHDLALVRAFANRVAILDTGRIVEQGDARAIIDTPKSAMAKALVAAAPRMRVPSN